jgi:hypothetical protein
MTGVAWARPAGRSSALAAVAIVALHASMVGALATAVAPRCDLCIDRPAPADWPVIWLTPFGTESSRSPGLRHGGILGSAPCADPYEVDLQGRLYDAGPASQALLASLGATSDGVFTRIALPCVPSNRPPPPRVVWSKQVPGEWGGGDRSRKVY